MALYNADVHGAGDQKATCPARSMVDSPATPNHYGHWSVPMSDLLTGNRQYCLDKAADCERKAAQARHPDAAKEFQSIAARWRVAAATRDFNQKVEDILRTLRAAASS
jgi:hypothetical protein